MFHPSIDLGKLTDDGCNGGAEWPGEPPQASAVFAYAGFDSLTNQAFAYPPATYH